MRRGFSLVELSIVLVILGLLVGGILAGQSLIRAAELRAVGTEFNRWQTAAYAFKDKYFGIPGDITNATQIWGRQASTADCVTNSSAAVNSSTGVCDGNGSSGISWDNSGAVGTAREMHQFWRQLAVAGLIEGTYTGLAGATGNSADVVPGENSPLSKVNNAGWGVAGGNNCGMGDPNCFYGANASIYRSYYVLGRRPSTGGNTPIEPSLLPEEAWNIDTKLDDGMPVTGKIISRYISAGLCTTASSMTDTAGTYNLSNRNKYCTLFFVRPF